MEGDPSGEIMCAIWPGASWAHELRAADSQQLAAALTCCQQRTKKRDFLFADERLSKAAASAGFSVLKLS